MTTRPWQLLSKPAGYPIYLVRGDTLYSHMSLVPNSTVLTNPVEDLLEVLSSNYVMNQRDKAIRVYKDR